jgi:predicted metal-dependent peptidase
MLKLTPQQRLERAVVRLISEPEFLAYSAVMMVGDTRIEPDPKKCPTAYTDGFNVVYGEKFIETLTDEELRFVILHETLHKMYRHTVVWQHLFRRSPILANVAAEAVSLR